MSANLIYTYIYVCMYVCVYICIYYLTDLQKEICSFSNLLQNMFPYYSLTMQVR